jgi:RHS repeat-associated protein
LGRLHRRRHYELQEKLNSGSWTTIHNAAGTSKARSGLGNGTWYYQVRACNNPGCSPWLTPIINTIVAITPGVPPSASVSPATSYDGSHTVSWTASSGTVTAYELERKLGAGAYGNIYTGTSLSYVDPGKAVGTYTYRVKACNTVSTFTSCSGWRTATAVNVSLPAVPANLTGPATDTDGAFTISWDAATGAATYELQESSNGVDWSTIQNTSAISKAVTGKGNGTWYYQVRACNNPGCSPWFTPPISVIVAITPGVPPSASASPATSYDGSHTVSWTASSGTVTAYELERKLGAGAYGNIYTGTSLSYVDPGKAVGTYTYRVKACNTVSTFTSCSGWRTATAVNVSLPAVPANLTGPATDTDGAFTISWDAATGAATYELQEKLNSGSWSTIQNTSAISKAVTGKGNGTWYYQVRACNNPGCSNWFTPPHAVVVTLPPGVPGAIDIDDGATSEDGAYTVSWTASTGTVTAYELEERVNGGNWTQVQASTSLDKAFSGKTEDTFDYRVRGCNGPACSDYTAVVGVMVDYPAPGTVNPLVGPPGSTDGDVALDWSAATGYLAYHEVEMTFADDVSIIDTESTADDFELIGLDNGTYRFRVRACNDTDDCGDFSNSITTVVSQASTLASPPDPTSSEEDPLEPLGEVFNGIVAGSHGVTPTGIATYSVPILVPPGTNGMQPELSLTYASIGSNSWLGLGWSVGGLGHVITRCGQSLVPNGGIHSVDFTDDDRFCLDGQQLLAIDGAYGADGTHYQTQLDSFMWIESVGTASGASASPEQWLIKDRAGRIWYLGSTADTRIEAAGSSEVRAWLTAAVEDRSGNEMTFTYTEDGSNGAFHPLRVEYSRNLDADPNSGFYAKVEFVYEDAPGIVPAYTAGSVAKVTKRLTNVQVSILDESETWQLVRDYQPDYETVDAQAFSRITSLDLCVPDGPDAGSDPDCAEATTFTWRAADEDYTTTSTGDWTAHSASSGALQKWADLDGDGRADYVTNSGATHYVSRIESDGGGYESYESWTAHATGSSGFEEIVDLNGDGLMDYVTTDTDGTHYWSISNGSDYETAQSYGTTISVSGGDEQHIKDIDMNGDGLPDYLRIAGGTTYEVALNNGGAGYQTKQTWTGGPDLGSIDAHEFQDVNRDGITDLVTVDGTSHRVYLNDGAGSFAEAASSPWSAHASSGTDGEWADLNGDGYPDYVSIDGSDTTKHYVSLSTGAGYVTAQWTANAVGTTDNLRAFEDMNGDGLKDFVTTNSSGDHLVSLSTGSGYDNNHTWEDAPAFGSHSDNVFDFVDLNGDGRLDFVSVNSSGTHNVGLNRTTPVYLLENVTDGLGEETEFTYAPLTDATVYMKGTGAAYPVVDAIDATQVVSEVGQSDGVGGVRSTTYRYEGLRLHQHGRGSLGFASLTVVDQAANTTAITEFNQSWPLIGLPSVAETWLTDLDANPSNDPDRRLSETTFTYDVKVNFDNGTPSDPEDDVLFPFPEVQQAKQYDSDSGNELLSTTTTTNDDESVDAFANVGETVVEVVDHHTDFTFYTYTTRTHDNDDSQAWLIGQLTQEVTSQSYRDDESTLFEDADMDRTVAYTYDAAGRLETQTIEPGEGAPLELTTIYGYDDFGNQDTVTLDPDTGTSGGERITTTGYDAQGRFAVETTNAAGHETSQTYDPRFGTVLTSTDPNGLTTEWAYDNFGRVILETRPDDSTRATAYHRVDTPSEPHPEGVLHVDVQMSGQGDSRSMLDASGRAICNLDQGFDGTLLHTDTEYDALGRTLRTSEPHYTGEDPGWTTPEYDLLDRVTAVETADPAQNSGVVYDGFTVTTTDAQGRKRIEVRDALGRTRVVVQKDEFDEELSRIEYGYDVAGNLVTITNEPGGGQETTVTKVYDRLGRLLSESDPDAGTSTFTYNAFGERETQTTPELADHSQSITIEYDALGRPIERVEPETPGSTDDQTTTWAYDDTTGGNLGVGQLTGESVELDSESAEVFSRSYFYDAADFGKLTEVQTSIAETAVEVYTTRYRYDAAGRVKTIEYPLSPSFAAAPEPFTVEYEYNVRGYQERVFQVEDGERTTLFYQATAVDAAGRVTGAWLGDGSLTGSGYDPFSGRLEYTHASLHNGGSPVAVQNLVYTYDALGNLESRSDLLRDLTERFTHDAFERLTDATVDDGTSTTPVSYDYDVLGNLTEKSDHGAYTYSQVDAGPHAVTSVLTPSPGSQTLDYAYDLNGNQISAERPDSSSRTLVLNSANLPIEVAITGTSILRTFRYAPDGQRFRQVHTDESDLTTVMHYVDTRYLRQTTDTTDTHRLYVFANGQAVAVLVDTGTETTPETTVDYLHRDPLGSLTALVNTDSGIDIEALSYDPFGRRRDPETWAGEPSTPPSESRGYTGHEHLDDVSLIHMNGRVYDPVLGRMLSPDPVVQEPNNGQNWNRYSYVLNNPLKYTDPSGFFLACNDAICGIGGLPVLPSFSGLGQVLRAVDWVISISFGLGQLSTDLLNRCGNDVACEDATRVRLLPAFSLCRFNATCFNRQIEIDLLAMLVFAEGSKHWRLPRVMEGIAWTVRNRVESGDRQFGNGTYRSTIFRRGADGRYQYKGVGNAEWRKLLNPATLSSLDKQIFNRALTVARGVYTGTIRDNVNGATWFHTGQPDQWFRARLADRTLREVATIPPDYHFYRLNR